MNTPKRSAPTENQRVAGTSSRRDFLTVAAMGTAVAGGLWTVEDAAVAATPAASPRADGADNFYKSDAVSVQKVTFRNQYQMAVVGNLFVPKTLDRRVTHPALVVGHPMGAVKE